MDTEESRVLYPLSCLLPNKEKDFCLVLLNHQVDKEVNLLKKLWHKAVFTSCVDGAANRLFDSLGQDQDNFIPNTITGDFDSARPEVLEFYKKKGAKIVETPDQDSIDFFKNLLVVLSQTESLKYESIVTLGGVGGCTDGRIDHLFANINTLFEIQKLTNKPIYIVSDSCLVCLLNVGHSTIKVDTGFEGPTCGLIPIGCSCDHVTTTGLKWNLDDQALKFGDVISSSNTFAGSSEVTIVTDKPLLWTMKYIY